MIQRFGLGVYPDDAQEWECIDRFPDTNLKQAVRGIYERLSELDIRRFQQDTFPDGSAAGLPYMRFSEEAQDLWTAWYVESRNEARADSEHAILEGWRLKSDKTISALALLFSLIDEPDATEVSADCIVRALCWYPYLASHAKRIFAQAITPEIAAAKALLQKIRAKKLPAAFTPRDVYRNGWALLHRDGVDIALSVLEDFQYLEIQDGKSEGRPTRIAIVNPKAMRAARE